MTRIFKNIIYNLLCLALLLQSCAPNLPTNHIAPSEKLNIPQNFPVQDEEKNAENPAVTKLKEQLINKDWRLFFKDEKLIALIEIALKNNQDLNILNQDINIQSNEVMARQGQYLPKLGIGAAYEFDKSSEYSNIGADDKASGVDQKLHNRQASLNASWEVDIWKKLRNSAKSSYYQFLASKEGKNFAITQLVAEIATNYYELMSLDNQLEIVNQYIKTLQEAQDVVQWQQIAGRTTSLAVTRFTAEVYKNQSREYRLKQQITITQNRLNSLLGRLPQPIERDSSKFKDIEFCEIDTDLPAALLDNRPDIKQASLKLEAAKLDVKSVKAQFYPSLNIDANAGYRSFNAQHFASASSFFYGIAGGLTAPLLNRNAIKADYFSANNRQIQAIYNYEKTFINAFLEVSNQLAAVNNLQKIYDLKSNQTNMLADSFEISNILFKAARIDYLESLLTRRDFLEAQLELIEVKQQQLSAHINLYRALGGGFKDEKENH